MAGGVTWLGATRAASQVLRAQARLCFPPLEEEKGASHALEHTWSRQQPLRCGAGTRQFLTRNQNLQFSEP